MLGLASPAIAHANCRKACVAPVARAHHQLLPKTLRPLDPLHKHHGAAYECHRPANSVSCASYIYSSGRSTAAGNVDVGKLRQELKTLEDERDMAIATAEASAKTTVKLTEMARLLDELALEKVKNGDEDSAKQALLEKASVKEVIDKNTSKAQINYALAAKVAQKIGDKQHELLAALHSSGQAAGPSTPTYPPPYGGSSSSSEFNSRVGSAYPTSSSSSGSSSSSCGSNGANEYGYRPPVVPKWQQSLEEARERLNKTEGDIARRVQAARMSAADSIAAAKARLAEREGESITDARARLRKARQESIAEAQQRLRKQDEETLAYVRKVMARYRRGEYVNEDELEFAFRQLERRFLL